MALIWRDMTEYYKSGWGVVVGWLFCSLAYGGPIGPCFVHDTLKILLEVFAGGIICHEYPWEKSAAVCVPKEGLWCLSLAGQV